MKKFFSGLLAAASIFSFCACGFVSNALEKPLPVQSIIMKSDDETGAKDAELISVDSESGSVKSSEGNAVEMPKIAETTEQKAEEKKEAKDTELVFIIDKSGSMMGLEGDTVGSFNSVIEEQKKDTENGKVYVTTVFFDHGHSKIHDREDIDSIKEMTREDYRPSGSTALLDAVGDTLTNLSKVEGIKDRNVVVAIITDGYENSSRGYSKKQVKELIETHQKEDGWNIMFFGAGIDAFSEGGNIGVPKHMTVNVKHDAMGMAAAFDNISKRVTEIRAAR